MAQIHYTNGSSFKYDFIPYGDPTSKLIIETKDTTITIECYKIDENNHIVHSSQNEESYFESGKNGLMKKLLKSLGDFQ